METLGLSSTPQKSDNIFQRLFWPTITNQYDVDLLGQQGFWVCVVIGALSGVLLLLTGQIVMAVFVAFIFFAGACGVRKRSVSAAVLMFTAKLLDIVSAYLIMPGQGGNPLVSIVVLMLLLANIRAAVISRRWLNAPSEESDMDIPERSVMTAKDRFANRLPVTLWPKIKYPFFGLTGLFLALTVVGTVVTTTHTRPLNPSGSGLKMQVSPPQ